MTKSHVILVGLILIGGCNQNRTSALDPDRILHMAGEEAGQITAPKERLTRQLNIANRQTENGHPGDARRTLADARQTLEHADKNALTDHQRLAGWISLSELARNAEDKSFANSALDQALLSLNDLTPVQARCEYVLGIEREMKMLRGDAPAAKLLVSAAEWAMEIPQQPVRRSAYVAFAEELFRCNDYDGARTVLRHDADAAWRSDSLTLLSDRARWENPGSLWAGKRSLAYAAGVKSATPAEGLSDAPVDSSTSLQPSTAPFGKALDFKSNFYRPR